MRGRFRDGEAEGLDLQSSSVVYSHIKGLHPEVPLPDKCRETAVGQTLQTEPSSDRRASQSDVTGSYKHKVMTGHREINHKNTQNKRNS